MDDFIMPVRYLYLRTDLKRNHLGAVCFGYQYLPNTELIEYATSVCNPKDHFNRKIAHKIIMGRLNYHPMILPDYFSVEPKYRDVFIKIMNHFLDNEIKKMNYSGWAKNLIIQQLNIYSRTLI